MANPSSLKPFARNDPRINRDGRPKDSIGLAELARRIGHEKAVAKDGALLLGPDGKPMTIIEMILRDMAHDPRRQEIFLDRAFGKVPTTTQLLGNDGEPVTLLVEYVNKRAESDAADSA